MSHAPAQFDLPRLMQDLEASLAAFEAGFPLEDFKRVHYQQQPCVTLLTCCDSRVPPTMLGDTFNRVFCVENIGNQVKNSAGSVLYGLLHLHTPLMIVAGHSECGAIKAATSDYAAEPRALVQELDTVKASLEQGCASLKVDLAAAAVNQAQLSELNVDVQVEQLLNHAEIAPLLAQQSLQIIGVVVDLHNVYGEGYGKVYTVNVNGEKDVAAIQARTDIGGFAAKAKRLRS
jgi:carbonic anhydrase